MFQCVMPFWTSKSRSGKPGRRKKYWEDPGHGASFLHAENNDWSSCSCWSVCVPVVAECCEQNGLRSQPCAHTGIWNGNGFLLNNAAATNMFPLKSPMANDSSASRDFACENQHVEALCGKASLKRGTRLPRLCPALLPTSPTADRDRRGAEGQEVTQHSQGRLNIAV